ncbi:MULTISPECIES: helix-turn-helix domain-containing protein [unclassified Roseitalea]|uniref:helix-turn-helix domain-containing protein n=1 Tax=unclassified Roseitalea TaxID=2639107 RepID=UPI00273EE07D|nr:MULTISPECIES: helix-turn-helix domain-containing protein [unclassified Roseitalea]
MSEFGRLLKQWRTRRRMSQMALALAADVSTRHISYLETAKSRPSRDMVFRLADALTVPANARNEWLAAAGFAPMYESRTISSAELAPFIDAVDRLLKRHDPYPGWLFDPGWQIVRANDVGKQLLRRLGISVGDNLIAAIARDPTMGGAIVNWRETALHLAQWLKGEAHRRNDADTLKIAENLAASGLEKFQVTPAPAAINTELSLDGHRIELVSIQGAFHTANDLTLANLRMELLFPVDAESERNLTEAFPQ